MMIRLGIVRAISYGMFGPPEEFMPQLRRLGAGLVRVYVYWAQVEPRPGEYDWRVVDALLAQLQPADDVWVTVCSSSPWATQVPTDFQPPSPATDDEAYRRFVRKLVERFDGRVGWWQCNNEPSNAGLLWAGTADEYVHQLRIFAREVRAADATARVVLGGCGYDMLSSPVGSEPWQFFDTVVGAAGDSFDCFDVHLYDDPRHVPGHVRRARDLMRSHGYEKEIVVGEHNGPTLFDFPGALAALEQAMMAAFAESAQVPAAAMSTADLAGQLVAETPDRRALRRLYDDVDRQPRELRMFMADPPAELAALRNRVACRQLVQRALLALAEGVRTLVCWNLAAVIGGYSDPYNVMDLMFGTLVLADWRDGRIADIRPTGHAHQLLARHVAGARGVEPLDIGGAHAFRIATATGPDRLVAWADNDDPLDESRPPRRLRLPWPSDAAKATDVFGHHPSLRLDAGWVEVEVGATPVFITAPEA
ncbi:hypothetical protein [Paractinoplanes globisporus]|uniref:Uncharacterized protein n=1 Tax=Paractinoplanes globisporus TaxID=113565 RepID=A0ABW6WL42_9ACTN|nr:hypothetical protein [Actinoplanes globisporus]